LRSEPEDEESEMDVTMGSPIDPLEAANAPPLWITEAELDHHIRWIAPEVWEIDRALVDRVSAESDLVTHEYRALPRERAGHVVGLAMYGIRRSSLFGRLGLQNGDVLVDINGVPLSSPEPLLNVESLARTTNSLFLRLERRGEERVHVYLLRQ
jgi:general secretion pathway protein C